jgi:hypothetical protein
MIKYGNRFAAAAKMKKKTKNRSLSINVPEQVQVGANFQD